MIAVNAVKKNNSPLFTAFLTKIHHQIHRISFVALVADICASVRSFMFPSHVNLNARHPIDAFLSVWTATFSEGLQALLYPQQAFGLIDPLIPNLSFDRVLLLFSVTGDKLLQKSRRQRRFSRIRPQDGQPRPLHMDGEQMGGSSPDCEDDFNSDTDRHLDAFGSSQLVTNV